MSLECHNATNYYSVLNVILGCFGVISAEEKDSISHRGKALKLFVEELKIFINCEEQ